MLGSNYYSFYMQLHVLATITSILILHEVTESMGLMKWRTDSIVAPSMCGSKIK